MSLRSPRLPGLVTLFPALAALGLAQLPLFRRPILNAAKRIMRVSEAQLPHHTDEWHTYEIDWQVTAVRFIVDSEEVLVAAAPPVGPLGFVAWIDNQYAVASPESDIRFGIVPTEIEQTLEIMDLHISS